MSDYQCPKCGGPMEPGGASCSKGYFLFKAESQGIRDRTTPIGKARACLQCGHVELFLDPGQLRQNLGR
jgi:hypothetical protein